MYLGRVFNVGDNRKILFCKSCFVKREKGLPCLSVATSIWSIGYLHQIKGRMCYNFCLHPHCSNQLGIGWFYCLFYFPFLLCNIQLISAQLVICCCHYILLFPCCSRECLQGLNSELESWVADMLLFWAIQRCRGGNRLKTTALFQNDHRLLEDVSNKPSVGQMHANLKAWDKSEMHM